MSESIFYTGKAVDWQRSQLDVGGPYSVWKAPAMPWWCVCDKNGTNVLGRGTGQVFTDEQTATALAEQWNG